MQNSQFRFLIAFIIGVVCQGHFNVSRAQAPVLNQISGNDINDTSIIMVNRFNPAAISFIPAERYLSISASYRDLNSNSLHLATEGDSQNEFRGEVTGFINKEKTSAFGNVYYSKGIKYNTKWSDVSDIDMVGPYIVADASGGNLQYEEYFISGTISKKYRFGNLAFSGRYRANSAYRTRDPRAADVVSDVNLGSGLVFNISKYIAGVAVTGDFYYQDVNIYFAEPDRKDYFYFLYGFGLEQEKISATYGSFSMNYSGSGVRATAFIAPSRDVSGWYLSGETKLLNVKAIFDDIVPGVYNNIMIKADAGYKFASGSGYHYLGGRFCQTAGKGTEQYYNTFLLDSTTTTTVTKLISKNTKYNKSGSLISLSYNSELRRTGFVLCPELYGGITLSESSYKNTPYRQSVDKWFVEGGCGTKWERKRSDIRIKLTGGYSGKIDAELIVPTDNEVSDGQLIPDFAFLSSSLINGNMLLQYDFRTTSGRIISAAGVCNILKSENDNALQFRIKLAYLL